MAIAAIYVLTALAFGLLYLGFNKQDAPILSLGSFLFIIIGLRTITTGFEDILIYPFTWVFGLIFIFTGFYILIRAWIEKITDDL